MALEFAEISVGGIAELLDVHRNTVSAWLNNRAKPDADMLVRIAELTDVDVEWLATGKVPPIGPGELVSFRSRCCNVVVDCAPTTDQYGPEQLRDAA